MTREKKSKLVDRAYQVFIGVAVIVIAGLLIGGGREYSDIKDNSDQVPGLRKDLGNVNVWIHHHDSAETVRYILDTARQGAMARDINYIKKRVD